MLVVVVEVLEVVVDVVFVVAEVLVVVVDVVLTHKTGELSGSGASVKLVGGMPRIHQHGWVAAPAIALSAKLLDLLQMSQFMLAGHSQNL